MLPMKTYEKTAFVLYHRLLLEFERNEKNKERKRKKKKKTLIATLPKII